MLYSLCPVDDPEKVQNQLVSIARYLGLEPTGTEEEECLKQEQKRVDGSCEWLLDKSNFKQWRDQMPSLASSARIFWLSGDPGCGKSVLAAHVTMHLRNRGFDTSCYFFKHGDVSQQSSGRFIKAVALQMAGRSVSLRRSLDQMRRDDTLTADANDVRALWKQLFAHRVLPGGVLERHQYLVVDSLDEARNGIELLGLLKTLPAWFSVFITCRKDRLLERELSLSSTHETVIVHTISKEDTLQDIRTYLERFQDDLHVDNDGEMQTLVQTLLDRSRGSFLWTKLMVQELSHWWTDEDIDRVLMNVPAEMNSMYNLMTAKIMARPNNDLAKVILRWIICATRPMTVSELRTAVKIETSKNLKNAGKAIDDICGPLVDISNPGGRVKLVHDTVRDYLFNKDHRRRPDESCDLVFDKASSHEMLATHCLSYLCHSLKALQHQASLRTYVDAENEALLDYASQNFSDHVVKSSWAEETVHTQELLEVLQEFFREAVLCWIHRQATAQNLALLTRVGRNLKAFAIRRSSSLGIPSIHLQEISGWANDLIHLITVFGRDLIKAPGSIDTIIPRLCPTSTRIFREFGSHEIGLQVYGLPRGPWPDRISSASFERSYAHAVASCPKYHAVSLNNCQIVLYRTTTCEEARRIQTSEVIKCLHFAHKRDWIVTTGRRTLTMYNYETGDQIWGVPTISEILTFVVTVNDSLIVAVTREKEVETFKVQNGKLAEKTQRLKHTRAPGRSPKQAHISEELGLIALMHRNEELELYTWPGLRPSKGRMPHSSNIEAIAFNPGLKQIAVSFYDGELCTVDLATMQMVAKTVANASHLAVSTDGRTLIAGTMSGSIRIFEFDGLDLMQEIHEESEVMALCFTSNNLRILDIRRQSFNIWEPAALVQPKDGEKSTTGSVQSTSFSTAPSQRVEGTDALKDTPISAIVEHHTGEFVICARENGSVFVHETMKGRAKSKLFDFGRTEVKFLAWNSARNLLASADNSGTVKLHEVMAREERHSGGVSSLSWSATEAIPKRTSQSPVRQVLFSIDGNLLLVSTVTKELIYNTRDGSLCLSHDCTPSPEQQSSKWAIFAPLKHHLFEIQRGDSHKISWEHDETSMPRIRNVQLHDPVYGSAEILYPTSHFVKINEHLWGVYDRNPLSRPVMWQSRAHFGTPSEPSSPSESQAQLPEIASSIVNVLGIYRSRLVYISTDNWVCSLRIDHMPQLERLREHFPIPHYWRSASRRVLAQVTTKGDIVVAVEGDLIVIKHGLE